MSDLPALREIERAAGELFRDIGMAEIADDEPPSVEALAGYVRAGRAWVAAGAEPVADLVADPVADLVAEPAAYPVAEPVAGLVADPVAYLIVDLVDGNVHVEQVSVHPRCSRRGIGRRLIDQAADYAVGIGAGALTLTTFTGVPWNEPYYRRCGFVVLDDAEIGPELRAVREHEAAGGLDRWPRVCMRRELTSE